MVRLAAVLCLLAATQAHARATGNTFTLAGSCGACHSGQPDPTVDVVQVTADPLSPGGSVVFRVTVSSNAADPTGRSAAFAASVPAGVGAFTADAETETCPIGSSICPGGGTGNGIRDVDLRPFVDGSYSWEIELGDLAAGDHTLSVGGNDVDGDTRVTNDGNITVTLPFTVAEGEGEGEGGEGEAPAEGEGEVPCPECEGGCSTSAPHAGPPLGVAALLLLGAFLRRRPDQLTRGKP